MTRAHFSVRDYYLVINRLWQRLAINLTEGLEATKTRLSTCTVWSYY